MLQIFQAYGDAILRLTREYGWPVVGIVMAVLVGHTVVNAIARFRINRGPKDP